MIVNKPYGRNYNLEFEIDYQNPFAVSDEETFTDQIIIKLDTKNVIEELPPLEIPDPVTTSGTNDGDSTIIESRSTSD